MCTKSKFCILSIIFLFPIYNVESQEPEEKKPSYGWKRELVGSLNLTQATFDNWTQGGENTLAWQSALNANFSLNQDKYNWTNTGKFSYGQAKIGDQDTRKSADEIKLESVFIYKFGFHLDPFVSAAAQTQFAKGYNYKDGKKAISNFMDPGYFTFSAGVGYTPNENIKTRLGGALKVTVTDKFPIPYSDDPKTKTIIEKTKTEGGISSVTDGNWKLNDNLIFTSKLDLFSNLKSLNQIDIRWDNLLTAKITKYINVNLNVELFYDYDISLQRQLREALAIGISYSLL